MKSIRTGYIGQADDQYLDHTRYDKDKAPEAGRKSDPKTGGAYTDIKLVNGKPEFMNKNGLAANEPGGTYYLKEADNCLRRRQVQARRRSGVDPSCSLHG